MKTSKKAQHTRSHLHDGNEMIAAQVPGLVNVDFADVRTIMAAAGTSLMGQGRCSGKQRAREAALAAISSPLLDIGIERATGIVWNITGPPDLTLFEVLGARQRLPLSSLCPSLRRLFEGRLELRQRSPDPRL